MSIKKNHVREWTTRLREPDLIQINGSLSKVVNRDEPNEGIGFCCLGVGESLIHTFDDEVDHEGRFSVMGLTNFPTPEFFDWLGVEVLLDEYDEWPEEPDPEIDMYLIEQRNVGPFGKVTCSSLNDTWKLTFGQIADLIDYFGLVDQLDYSGSGQV